MKALGFAVVRVYSSEKSPPELFHCQEKMQFDKKKVSPSHPTVYVSANLIEERFGQRSET